METNNKIDMYENLDKKEIQIIKHRICVKAWKEKNRERHLYHRKRESINKKIKFIFLNILLD